MALERRPDWRARHFKRWKTPQQPEIGNIGDAAKILHINPATLLSHAEEAGAAERFRISKRLTC
jgi:hypothetical protein